MEQVEKAMYEKILLDSYEENLPDLKMNVWGFILGLVFTATGFVLGSDSIRYALGVLGIALLGWFGRAAYIALGISASIRKRTP